MSLIRPHMQSPDHKYIVKSAMKRLCRLIGISATLATLSLGTLPSHAQTLSEKILGMERGLEQEFEDYFEADLAEVTQSPQEQSLLFCGRFLEGIIYT